MSKATYSRPIAKAIEKFLREEKREFSFDGEAGIFTTETWTTRRFEAFPVIFLVGKEDYTVFGLLPMTILAADAQKKAALTEFVCRVNCGLRRGSFDFDLNAGQLLCKSHVSCADGTPSYRTIGRSFYHLMDLYGLYGDGFLRVFAGNRTPEAVVEEIESAGKNPNAELLYEEIFERFVKLYGDSIEHSDNGGEDEELPAFSFDLFGQKGE